MELYWVTTFLTIVDNRGFGRAAELLHCSQPTVSNHVASLERELGASLLHRNRRPVELTQAGAAFLPHARALVREVEAAKGSVAEVLGLRRGAVTLGSYPSATAAYVPDLLERFRARYPGVSVRLVESRADDLARVTLDGEVELMLRPTTPPLSASTFSSQPLWRERYKVVLHPAHPLTERPGPISLAAVADHGLIMTGHGELANPEHPLWHHLGRYPELAYEVTQPQSLIELVRRGLGVGVTNELSLNVAATEGLVIQDIDAPMAFRDVAVWWVTGRTHSPAAHALLTFIRDGPRPPGAQPPG
ncbi:LysR family transcriptional regulator [Jiangella anatolica]|uniref:LysR family transcriptional regulator n=1 Tax=Jiangella anatolica TaxID=2670374 RepID=A0A2W2B6Y5_9ACTN|nr:LysR family transcriptional regulator [Jiangella anatolica]PZF80810.1 LysR family transcriptional regulator [Jiangella anatolica]